MNEATKKDLMEDPEDLGLQAVMGSHFQDQTREPTSTPKGEKRQEPVIKAPTEKKKAQKVTDAPWVPVKAEPADIQRITNCAKQTALYGGISVLLFWWQQAGLLASEAAMPSFIVLALLTGLKIGYHMK